VPFCQHCGTQIPDSADFCGGCGKPKSGTALPVSGETVADSKIDPKTEKWNKRASFVRSWKFAVLVALIIPGLGY
jgi:uncharacterized membrane protein YvbJ